MSSIKSDCLKIWVLEDDEDLCSVFEEALGLSYQVDSFRSFHSFSNRWNKEKNKPQLLLVDLNLNDGSFLGKIRSPDATVKFGKTPIVVISSCDDLETISKLFSFGIRDYLTKPFNMNELLCKIERILANEKDNQIVMDKVTGRVVYAGQTSEALTNREQQILHVLLDNATKTVSRKELEEKVWRDIAISEKALDVHLCNIRKKIAIAKLRLDSTGEGLFRLFVQEGDNIMS